MNNLVSQDIGKMVWEIHFRKILMNQIGEIPVARD